MESVVHFEMPYDDAQRAAKFYQNTFGWKTQLLGPEMGHYLVLDTADKDANPKGFKGAIGGGMFQKQAGIPNAISVVIGVEDVHSSMQKIKDNGGEVIGQPQDIPGIGLYVAFEDTEGNRNSILQPSM